MLVTCFILPEYMGTSLLSVANAMHGHVRAAAAWQLPKVITLVVEGSVGRLKHRCGSCMPRCRTHWALDAA